MNSAKRLYPVQFLDYLEKVFIFSYSEGENSKTKFIYIYIYIYVGFLSLFNGISNFERCLLLKPSS